MYLSGIEVLEARLECNDMQAVHQLAQIPNDDSDFVYETTTETCDQVRFFWKGPKTMLE